MQLSGLVTLDEMRAKQEDVIKARERQIASSQEAARLKVEENQKAEHKKKIKQVSAFIHQSLFS